MTMLVRTSIDPETSEIVAKHLQDTLYEFIDLGLQAKQAHWNVTGPRFRAVHQHLDELVDVTRPYADTVAERMVTIGAPANGLASQIAHSTKLEPMPTGYVKDDEVVRQIIDRLSGVCSRLRDRIAVLQDRDPVSADMLTGQLAKLEEQLWMFHAQAQ